ncbi:diaminopimelate decarboxylase [Stackebrandtia nassauensis]|uniref:Diaminopimelate decarboxylase n=1 Tax=Stackebrandtia nassauensis (strain DSM 44728 / CIP 108903 / NRRL B-16338 / NBRC 102104 / LLR-40K-21) TaxID=446470 RepID=D3PWV4_STANL|nr:diaminopimelate decarboxylase [Stackebrandtia nassauensis]ADD45178.1 diaminopimelate decarboxylase [Stackebrandtia nassauensis DSM 44728]
MRVHEAGALHEEYTGGHGPAWLRMPVDVNDLIPQLWARTVNRDDAGVLTVGGVDVNKLAAEFGTAAYVVDEADFRSRLRDFRGSFSANFPDGAVYYAGKSFLCKAVARWVAEEGVNLDICTGGELATAVAAGFPGERLAFHGNNKSEAELAAALDAGVGTIVLDSRIEVERLTRLAKQRGVRPGVMVRTKVGVEAHTHEYIATAHEDQKFGLSLEAAVKAAKHILAADVLHLKGLHSHIGSQIFETTAFEVAARRVIGAHEQIQRETGKTLPELGLGGGFGIAYTTQDDPQSPRQLADGLRKIVDHECDNLGIDIPSITVEPGRAISGPTTFTLYEVGTVKSVDLGAGRVRSYVSVDGGMSDNIRTAMYGATYSVTLASRLSDAPPILGRVVGKHCEAGDIIVRDEFLPGDIKPGDLIAVPGTGAYCRSMASNYNHVPRPPVVAVADGTARLIVRGESVDDLLNLDVG